MEPSLLTNLAFLFITLLMLITDIDFILAHIPEISSSLENDLYTVNSAGYVLPFHLNPVNRKTDEDAIITKISEPKFRVIGGVESNAGGVPYQICIRWYPFCNCGGAIYNSKTIITAAHCFHSPTEMYAQDTLDEMVYVAGDFNIRVEEGNEQRLKAKRIIIHPEYSPTSSYHDIAIVLLNESFTYNEFVQPISLGRSCLVPEKLEVGMVSGWGYTKVKHNFDPAEIEYYPNKLRETNVKIFQRKQCARFFSKWKSVVKLVNAGHMCAGSISERKDTCQGDSGGPLACYDKNKKWRRFLCGIISTGIGCGLKGLPGLYTRVADYRDWIIENGGDADEPTEEDTRPPIPIPT